MIAGSGEMSRPIAPAHGVTPAPTARDAALKAK
jgi:hypothetical protein